MCKSRQFLHIRYLYANLKMKNNQRQKKVNSKLYNNSFIQISVLVWIIGNILCMLYTVHIDGKV